MATPQFHSTVGQILERSAARVPERIALHFADREWTYAELDGGVSRVAHELLAMGLEKGDRVAAYGKNSDAYVILYLACARAGLVHVPVNYNAVAAELEYLLEQSGSRVVFADAGLAANVGRESHDLRERVREWAVGAGGEHREEGVRDDDLVQLLYTSGTTSKPKGAMMTHRAFIHEYMSCIQALDLREDDLPLHSLPLYHSAQMHVFMLPYLAIGATSHLVEAPDVTDILDRVERDGVTSVFAPPTVWVGVANHSELRTRDLSALKAAYYGASIMPVPVLQTLRQALPGVGFYNCFGQSEIGPLATVLRPEEHEQRPDSAGRPVMFVQVRVVDADGNDSPVGELGEVVYRSPQLCTGYWDKPEETAEAFAGGWFHSGDLVRADEEGYLYVVDRIKDVINTGGVLVASREVEEVLYEHPAVEECAVIGLPHERWIEAIAAVVVTHSEVRGEDLIAFARERLAAHKVPKSVHIVDELPKNPSGKLLKRELRERLGGSGSAVARG
jgi:fatty-acyl-CoA synthase